MSLKVQGTTLFFVDPGTLPSGSDDTIVQVACITSFDGLTASREQTDVTCLQDESRRTEAGLLVPGTATFGINFDPKESSHRRLHALYKAGTVLEWALAASDGTASPTGITSAGGLILPTTRTFWAFEGFISDFPFAFAVGARVASTLSVQLSDFPTLNAKA